MRIGALQARSGPEIGPAARVRAAIKRLHVGRDALRHSADAANRSLLQARDVHVEERAWRGFVGDDLFDNAPCQLRGAGKVERLDLGVFQ